MVERANAMGHLMAAVTAKGTDGLWDLMGELAERAGKEGPGMHSLPAGAKRYCLHPTSEPDVEIRHDDLRTVLTAGCLHIVGLLDESDTWVRG